MNPASAQEMAALRARGLFDATWYGARHADVLRSGLSAEEHFRRIGWALGRDPGPGFSVRFYQSVHADVMAAEMDPLRHYLASGWREGRLTTPPACGMVREDALTQVSRLRQLMETGGLTAGPCAALTHHAGQTGAPAVAAAEALGFWHLHSGAPDQALHWFSRALALAPGAAQRLRLDPLRIIAAQEAGERAQARALAEAAPENAARALAETRLAETDTARLACLNRAFMQAGLAPARLAEGPMPAFDRLDATAPVAETGGPCVSVLLAARNAEATLPAALRSLCRQSWQALEILVIDDASTDGTAAVAARAAAADPRIRLLSLPQNLGAYGARNAGLAVAQGAFITLHDADDWAHPERISRQMRFLCATAGHAGVMSLQARLRPDLGLSRWTGTGEMLFENLPSLLLPTALLRQVLGGWDRVKVSADSELLRRLRHLFGPGAVATLPDGPLALQRDDGRNATADSATGMGWFYYGARREYYEAQLWHHRQARCLRYPPEGTARPFPAPAPLDPQNSPGATTQVTRVYAGLMSQLDAGVAQLLDWLEEDRQAGRSAALVPLYATAAGALSLHPLLRARIDGERLRVLCFGERVRCETFQRLPGQRIDEPHRYLPEVDAGGRAVLRPGAVPAAG
ncbi:glycosyltransferase family 2 protein [Rhodobacter maris]|uniref:Glycosyl transferase family 2 n=1 Tax=Rhodobacter maris TaxID=446682 RepID=A0A285SGB5_9RHOB|nr:glycosyltransferase family 2 protein [Rhodobacter maris]SOC06916.1 glycosyl transferase family 2 [Rhodobacter maris]